MTLFISIIIVIIIIIIITIIIIRVKANLCTKSKTPTNKMTIGFKAQVVIRRKDPSLCVATPSTKLL